VGRLSGWTETKVENVAFHEKGGVKKNGIYKKLKNAHGTGKGLKREYAAQV